MSSWKLATPKLTPKTLSVYSRLLGEHFAAGGVLRVHAVGDADDRTRRSRECIRSRILGAARIQRLSLKNLWDNTVEPSDRFPDRHASVYRPINESFRPGGSYIVNSQHTCSCERMMDEHELELRLRLREVEDNLGMLMAHRSIYQEKLGIAEWANVDDMYEKVGDTMLSVF